MPTSGPPQVVEYDLGEATLTQSMFAEDSRFRNMPVRLNGIIAAPTEGNGPFPVVLIMHGNHPGCPIPEGDEVDRWPCDPQLEQPNYRGFAYLVRELAENGYVALSININAENTFGFGEPIPGERLGQLIDMHLQALAEASRGGPNPFDVDLQGSADLNRLAFIGHSRGGDNTYWLTREKGLAQPDAFARLGYGPVAGLLMVAPAGIRAGFQEASVPLAIILPACDRDVFHQEGQIFYEATRMNPEQSQWASSVWLERANHNFFNEILRDEAAGRPDRPDCEPILEPDNQRDFLSSYTLDFLETIFSQDTGLESSSASRLGMDFQGPAPDELYGLPARVAALAPYPDRLPLLLPASDAELESNLAGGSVSAAAVTTFFCEEGYYTPMMKPGSEPCKRVNLTVPGNPAMIVLSWSQEGGELRFTLPEASDLSQYTAVSLRAALDPLSPLNNPGSPQAFLVRLTDKNGDTASVRTGTDEPALQFPPGEVEDNEPFEGGLFTGRVPLTTIRLLLSDFTGVDLAAISEIALVFDQTPSGSLFAGDIELVR